MPHGIMPHARSLKKYIANLIKKSSTAMLVACPTFPVIIQAVNTVAPDAEMRYVIPFAIDLRFVSIMFNFLFQKKGPF